MCAQIGATALNTWKTVIVPTFDTKVTKNLCSGVFFSSDKFRLFNSPFLTEFLKYHSKGIVVLSLNLKKISPVTIFCKIMGV